MSGEVSKEAERVKALIQQGRDVLETHRPNSSNVIGFPTLNYTEFSAWKGRSLTMLTTLLGREQDYVREFAAKVEKPYKQCTETGIGILLAVLDDLEAGFLSGTVSKDPTPIPALARIENLANRFHTLARQLRQRHEGRSTLDVEDEYDVQDLLHALLILDFADIRAEEYSPSYAGKHARTDLFLKHERIFVEVKMARRGLGAKELGSQLIEDIARYETHPDCTSLICFVYDPEGLVINPRGLETDLSRTSPYPVRVLVRPA